MEVHWGTYRVVVVANQWAIKFPYASSWPRFREGLLANRRERWYSRTHPDCERLCPVLLADPLGILLVMPRAQPLTNEQWTDLGPPLGLLSVYTTEREIIPGEAKRSSLGTLGDQNIVIVDYVDHT